MVSLLNEPSLERVREHKLLTSQASILKKETRASSLPEKGNYAARAFQRTHTGPSRGVLWAMRSFSEKLNLQILLAVQRYELRTWLN